MSEQAKQELGRLEDADNEPLRSRTFEEAVAYAIEQGYCWLVYDGRFYRMVNSRAVEA